MELYSNKHQPSATQSNKCNMIMLSMMTWPVLITVTPEVLQRGEAEWPWSSPSGTYLLETSSTACQDASQPYVKLVWIKGSRFHAPDYITKPGPPRRDMEDLQLSRQEQKLGFPERGNQSSTSSLGFSLDRFKQRRATSAGFRIIVGRSGNSIVSHYSTLGYFKISLYFYLFSS